VETNKLLVGDEIGVVAGAGLNYPDRKAFCSWIKGISPKRGQITLENGLVFNRRGYELGYLEKHIFHRLVPVELIPGIQEEIEERDRQQQEKNKSKEERNRIWQEKLPRIEAICEQASLQGVQALNKGCGSEFQLEPEELNQLKMWVQHEMFSALREKFY
jgi:hypothetical protein